MTELIKVNENGGKQAVSARDLHVFLESKKDFSSWIKGRIEKYSFEEGLDYYKVTQKGELGNQQLRIEYVLTMDTAKELAMVEGNEKGKLARKYFLECEARLKALQPRLSPAELILQQAQQLVDHERRLDDIDTRVKKIEASQPATLDMHTILGYAILKHTKLTMEQAQELGKRATRICKEKSLKTGLVADPRFTHVRSYPKEVLELVFNEFLHLDKNY